MSLFEEKEVVERMNSGKRKREDLSSTISKKGYFISKRRKKIFCWTALLFCCIQLFNLTGQNLTVHAASDPDPALLMTSITKETITVGETTTIIVCGTNYGDYSPEGYISVSLPELTQPSPPLSINPFTDLPNAKISPKGSTIYDIFDDSMTAEYVLIDGWDMYWENQESQCLQIDVTPTVPGTYHVYMRMILRDNDSSIRFCYPSTSPTTDQQGWPVIVREFTVIESKHDTQIDYLWGDSGIHKKFGEKINLAVKLKDVVTGEGINGESLYLYFGDGSNWDLVSVRSTQNGGVVEFSVPTLEYEPFGTPHGYFVDKENPPNEYNWYVEFKGSAGHNPSDDSDEYSDHSFWVGLDKTIYSLKDLNPGGVVENIEINNNAGEAIDFILDALMSAVDSYYGYVVQHNYDEPLTGNDDYNLDISIDINPCDDEKIPGCYSIAEEIRISKRPWLVYSDSDSYGLANMKELIAHEMMHAIQARTAGPYSFTHKLEKWTIEGIASLGPDIVFGCKSPLISEEIKVNFLEYKWIWERRLVYDGGENVSPTSFYLFYKFLYLNYGGDETIRNILRNPSSTGIQAINEAISSYGETFEDIL
ncbi:MAG: hypothetical protein HXS54_11840 [Theionarchaea archaeon]|nr:hypothetical protein [Theionarchaea archaeon]